MFTVNDEAVGPHLPVRGAGPRERRDHERLVLEARDVEFDWAKLPFHYVPGEPFTTHVLNVLHLLLPAGEEFFVDVFKQILPLIKDDQLRLDGIAWLVGEEEPRRGFLVRRLNRPDVLGVDLAVELSR